MKDQNARPLEGSPATGPVTGTNTARWRGRLVAVPLVGLTVVISGCGGSPGPTPAAAAQEVTRSAEKRPAPARSAERPPSPAPIPPAPDVAIPGDPSRLAGDLVKTTADLRQAIDGWTGKNDPAPEPVVLLALHQQRVYRHLARNPKLAARTYAELPKALAGQAKDNVKATSNLRSLVRPLTGTAKFRVRPPEPAGDLLRAFRKAERRFGVEWEVLAAVMFVETKFGRVRSPSHTGAKGPMQFMPGTWKAYGMGGDVHDTDDALLAAANYLHASGAPGDYRRALYAYNHSYAYVDAVLLHARQMKRDIRNFYAYYNWQVFVITTRGDRRLTGPEPR
ncbi:lytic transglycosylase domain-containing protein [Streptosporangium soli]|nr:transglycosylase SLT domain-containing protein [Streptosporangium sp. KLBMP 9127]